MKRILTQIAIGLFLSSAVSAFQAGRAESSREPSIPHGSVAGLPLRRVQPQTRTVGELLLEPGVGLSTAMAFDRYLAAYYQRAKLTTQVIYKLPNSVDRFFAITYQEDGAQNLFFVFAERGGSIDELSHLGGDTGSGNWTDTTNFFIGADRVLILVSISAVDGYMLINYAFELKNSRLLSLGKIDVYKAPFQRPYSTEPFHSPFNRGYGPDSVAAEYNNGSYRLLVKGPVYVACSHGVRRIDDAKSRTILSYDGNSFRPMINTRIKRRCEEGML